MKVVVAMDSFKGSLSAAEACEAVARGIRQETPHVELVLCPMADGGEGTAETLISATGGTWIPARVTGPLPGTEVEAGYAWLPGEPPGALVEMAAASGLALLRPDELDPLHTTTFGSGQLLAKAAERGAERLWLAIGGSATVDGGTGAARALGWRFLDAEGEEVGLGGGELERIVHLERPARADPLPPLEVLCDVDNPLLGPRGAARVFGPQKGATPEMVERLEAGLAHLADVVERELGVDVREIPGAGAAGGFGAGAVAFLGGRLVSGVDAVMNANGLRRAVEGAAWVVTGEGRFDDQSLHGKVVSGVLRVAAGAGARVAVVAGSVRLTPELASAHGVEVAEAAAPEGVPLPEALARAGEFVEAAARRFARSRLGGDPEA